MPPDLGGSVLLCAGSGEPGTVQMQGLPQAPVFLRALA